MRTLIATLLAAAALQAPAASVVPAEPRPLEPVNLRMTVDSCVFDPDATRLHSMNNNHIIVQSRRRQCLVPGTPQVVDIQLGAFPPGDYSASVHHNPNEFAPPYEEVRFTVREGPQIAVFPPPTRPFTDYSGLWWNPDESGWGLSVHQGPGHNLFAMLFVYGTGSQPEWYTLQMGRWTSFTTWSGTIFRTTGPSYTLPMFNPAQVQYQTLGPAVLEFRQAPGMEGTAQLTYTIHDATVTKRIQRMPL